MTQLRSKIHWFVAAAALLGWYGESTTARAQTTARSRELVTNQWTGSPVAPPTGMTTPTWNPGQPNSWRLGVAIENLETGVLLTDVERGLPAETAGLKRGDVIISVSGFQVGYVEGGLFDLGDELRRRTDPQGRVTMLVFDGRNRQLRSMPVTLVQNNPTGVRGQVQCRERITLSSQATLTVRLRDVTFASWQNITVGQHVIANPPHPPIPFAIDYDPSTVYPDHRYQLDAWVVDRGQVVLQTAQPIAVNPLTNTSQLQVALVKPAGSNTPGPVYAASSLEQVNQWYRQYLLRDATPQELAAWQAHLQAGRSTQDVQAYILSSSEYYDRMGNQSARYLNELYRTLFGRQPTPAELGQFQNQYAQYGGARSQFVADVLRRAPAQ